jgi:hypothetical protein
MCIVWPNRIRAFRKTITKSTKIGLPGSNRSSDSSPSLASDKNNILELSKLGSWCWHSHWSVRFKVNSLHARSNGEPMVNFFLHQVSPVRKERRSGVCTLVRFTYISPNKGISPVSLVRRFLDVACHTYPDILSHVCRRIFIRRQKDIRVIPGTMY